MGTITKSARRYWRNSYFILSIRKLSHLQLLLILFVIVLTSAFTSQEATYTVTIQGVENRDILKDGVTGPELTEVTVGGWRKDLKVREFEIILARGQSPVGFPSVTVKGNKYDLEKYRKIAKPGDRILITLKKLADSTGLVVDVRNSTLAIPIK